jgi:hypothetical protein
MDLPDLLIDAAIVSVDAQSNLDDVLGGAPLLGIDLSEGTATFGEGAAVLTAVPHFVGTASPSAGTWLWGWHNVNGYPDEAVSLVGKARDLGEDLGIAQLADATVDLDDHHPVDVAVALATAASYAAGGVPIWVLDAGAGTVAAFLMDHERLRLPPADGPRVLRVLSEAVGTAELTDPRRSITAYAEYRGLPIATEPDGGLRLTTADGDIVVTFDDHDRLANMAASFGG